MKTIRYMLFPFAVVFDFIIFIRNFLYNTNVFKSTSFNIPVIAIGNLSTGGTGKTPQAEYLIRLLKNEYKVALLSRGYKRKTKGFLLVEEKHIVEEVGDEPLQFFTKFNSTITVAVDANRTHGIQQLIAEKNAEVILLDDAFQHRKVKAGYYILLTKFNDLYVDDSLLPAGNLRESGRGAKRADCIIVTKCPGDLSQEAMKKITKKLKITSGQKIYFTCITYNETTKGAERITIPELQHKEIVLITGIANPNSLLSYLSSQKIKVTHINFPDHHNFLASDIRKIKEKFEAVNSQDKVLLTTEKDYMRLKGKLSNLLYIDIQIKFIASEGSFITEVFNFIRS